MKFFLGHPVVVDLWSKKVNLTGCLKTRRLISTSTVLKTKKLIEKVLRPVFMIFMSEIGFCDIQECLTYLGLLETMTCNTSAAGHDMYQSVILLLKNGDKILLI